jgi:hypothetical protein
VPSPGPCSSPPPAASPPAASSLSPTPEYHHQRWERRGKEEGLLFGREENVGGEKRDGKRKGRKEPGSLLLKPNIDIQDFDFSLPST